MDGGTGIDRMIMRGHNNHTLSNQLNIRNIEQLYADEPNLYARLKHLTVFDKIFHTGDDNFFTINIEGPGGTLDLTGVYNSPARLTVDATSTTSRVIVIGSARGDDFSGSEFNDVWTGGTGRDDPTGNGGNDLFRFTALNHSVVSNPDRIQDFDQNGNDRIDLSQLFGPALKFRGQSAFTGLGQVRIVDSGADVIVQVNVVGNINPDLAIRLINVDPISVTAGDFVL
jgi:Ca2+-binding RTX toxin-like protein